MRYYTLLRYGKYEQQKGLISLIAESTSDNSPEIIPFHRIKIFGGHKGSIISPILALSGVNIGEELTYVRYCWGALLEVIQIDLSLEQVQGCWSHLGHDRVLQDLSYIWPNLNRSDIFQLTLVHKGSHHSLLVLVLGNSHWAYMKSMDLYDNSLRETMRSISRSEDFSVESIRSKSLDEVWGIHCLLHVSYCEQPLFQDLKRFIMIGSPPCQNTGSCFHLLLGSTRQWLGPTVLGRLWVGP